MHVIMVNILCTYREQAKRNTIIGVAVCLQIRHKVHDIAALDTVYSPHPTKRLQYVL